jgi:hypothetical protein
LWLFVFLVAIPGSLLAHAWRVHLLGVSLRDRLMAAARWCWREEDAMPVDPQTQALIQQSASANLPALFISSFNWAACLIGAGR